MTMRKLTNELLELLGEADIAELEDFKSIWAEDRARLIKEKNLTLPSNFDDYCDTLVDCAILKQLHMLPLGGDL